MPELPEVETVRRGLVRLVAAGTRIERLELCRRDLRFEVPRSLPGHLRGQPLTGFRRWGKYLLWDTPKASLLCHLGMSGSWREAPRGEEREHDHAYLHLADGRRLAYRDPRRFGLLDLVHPGREAAHPRLAALGPDALDDRVTGSHLRAWLDRRRAPIKALLLDQRLLAGVGNIYACEALFRARIRPQAPAGRISLARLERLAASVRGVLQEAITAGGSTIRDFRQAGGESGYFQHRFQVYGRGGEPCRNCPGTLRATPLAGRATVWCPRCQR